MTLAPFWQATDGGLPRLGCPAESVTASDLKGLSKRIGPPEPKRAAHLKLVNLWKNIYKRIFGENFSGQSITCRTKGRSDCRIINIRTDE